MDPWRITFKDKSLDIIAISNQWPSNRGGHYAELAVWVPDELFNAEWPKPKVKRSPKRVRQELNRILGATQE